MEKPNNKPRNIISQLKLHQQIINKNANQSLQYKISINEIFKPVCIDKKA